MFNARKFAAVDLASLGPRVILPEFILGVLGLIGLGILTLAKIRSVDGILLGVYVLLIGMNFIPLLWHAISIVKQGSALQEISEDVDDQRTMFRKYRRQTLLLLLPLIVPAVAIWDLTNAKRRAAKA